MASLCSIECINIGCPVPSFLQQHETFLLTVISLTGTGFGVLLAYCLKSKCEKISVCCGLFTCKRAVIDTPVTDTTIDVEVGDSPSISSLNQ